MARGPFYQPGRYWGRIVAQAIGMTSKNNPQFVLTFKVIGKVNPEDPDGELLPVSEQYERSIFKVITDKTIDYVMEDLQKLGFDRETFKELDPNTPGFQSFVGNELAFYCDHDTYEGTVREKWGLARDGSGLQIKPLEPKQMRELDSLFGKHLKKMVKAKPVKPATPSAVAPATVDDATNREFEAAVAAAGDDEIPF